MIARLPPELRGAITPPRSRSPVENRPWRVPPPTWTGPQTEWACYWYLSIRGIEPNRRKLRVNQDYYYQRGLSAPGLFRYKPFTRGDFVLPGFGRARYGVVLDPLTPFTHQQSWEDLTKRRVLALQGWQVIFIDAWRLDRQFPGYVIELALAGTDISLRGGIR
jgi:hypothetical protein